MTADFNEPQIDTTEYTKVLDQFRENINVTAQMFFDGAANNTPINSIQLKAGVFSRWDGASFNTESIAIAGGGTGSTTAAGARSNLNVPSNTELSNDYLSKAGNLSGLADKSVSRTELDVYGKSEMPDATTSQKGFTQLNNTLTSTSTTQALTAAQGKALNDKFDSPATTIWTGSQSTGISTSDIFSQTGFTVKRGRYSIRYATNAGTYNGELYIRSLSDISANTIDTRERNLTGTSYLYSTIALFNDNTSGVGLLDRFGVKFIRDTGTVVSATVSQIDYIGS